MALTALTIGETADLLGITPKAIRHYHRIGLLAEPPRAANGYRRYDLAAIQRLQAIIRLSRAGLALRQIKFVLDADDPDRVLAGILAERDRALESEIARLHRQQGQIRALLAEEAPLSALVNAPPATDSSAILAQSVRGISHELAAAVAAVEADALHELDRAAWSAGYADFWEEVGRRMAARLRHAPSALILWLERYLALADLEQGDPQAAAWLHEFAGSATRALLAHTFALPQTEALPAVEQARIERVFPLLLFERSTALQREFICMVVGNLSDHEGG